MPTQGLYTPSEVGMGNTDANAIGSVYGKLFGHKQTPYLQRMLMNTKKKRKKKIYDAAPKQYYANGVKANHYAK